MYTLIAGGIIWGLLAVLAIGANWVATRNDPPEDES